jgi:prolyl-tRNA synthetase
MYKKWIQSYRDLPILINQWCNVVRWEKRTRLFLRTTEFLWQEGHTAHATAAEAQEETLRILDVYRRFAEEYMAIPVLHGVKTDAEKFAGAVRTYCIEALMQDRKSLQAGTSHNLGQNFARAFDVTFQTREKTLDHVWATSWGVSTRLIGAVIMAHSDDKGLVLPPRLAPVEVVIVPIFKNETKERVLGFARSLRDTLRSGFRVLLDEDDQNTPGWKFSEYELQGIPLRVEVGPRDMEKGQVVAVRRDTGEKTFVPVAEAPALLRASLEDIQAGLYRRALEFRRQNTFRAADYGEFRKLIDEPGGFIEAGWCGDAACEAKVKEETKATIRLIPLERKDTGGSACMVCGKTAQDIAVFARAY